MHKHEWIHLSMASDYLTMNDNIVHFGAWYQCWKCKEQRHISCSDFYFHPQDAVKKCLPKWSLFK